MNEKTQKMNCEQYQQAIAADPSESFEGGREHAATCSDCSELREEYRAVDARIASALAVDVPDLKMPELPDHSDDNVVTLAPRKRFTSPAWFGLAAAFALAAYFGLLTLNASDPSLSLANQVIAHLDHEEGSRIVTNVAVSERTLNSVVSNQVAEMDSGIGLITYARSCVINGIAIPHLVIQGERGPVTLLLMPDEAIDQAITLDGVSINGVILPNGNGSIAIIGERGEQLDTIGNRVVDAVKWKT